MDSWYVPETNSCPVVKLVYGLVASSSNVAKSAPVGSSSSTYAIWSPLRVPVPEIAIVVLAEAGKLITAF
jgi:ubiquitin C-terminal hydrolase